MPGRAADVDARHALKYGHFTRACSLDRPRPFGSYSRDGCGEDLVVLRFVTRCGPSAWGLTQALLFFINLVVYSSSPSLQAPHTLQGCHVAVQPM